MDAVVFLFYSHVAAATADVLPWGTVLQNFHLFVVRGMYILLISQKLAFCILCLPYLFCMVGGYIVFYRQWQNSKFL
jgi:hypothetical protein